MKSFKFIFAALLLGVFFIHTTAAQSTGMVKKTAVAVTPAIRTDTIQVLGNCGMCKKTIETAAASAGTISADWNADTHQLTVTFDPSKTSVDAIEKAVALSGYDNAGYKAPDSAYNGLHACCQYDRTGAPGTAKSCGEDAGN